MIYSGDKTSCISLPLGGIGAGSIGLAGNGSLVDWEIFNAPAKGRYNGFSHFAVRAEEDGQVTDVRILNGDLQPHYIGNIYKEFMFSGAFGCGPSIATMAGMPHFRKHTFEGTYPVGRILFEDEKFPADCALTAWSVFIPGESKASSLPAAFFEIDLENNTERTVTYTVIGFLTNPWVDNSYNYNTCNNNILTCYDGKDTGDITLAIDSPGSKISYQTYLHRGIWQETLEIYYRDLLAGGDFKDRQYSHTATYYMDGGILAARFTLAPGEKKSTRFVITWHVPFRTMDVPDRKELAEKYNAQWTWKNYYAVCWENSQASSAYAMKNYNELRRKTFCFRDSLFGGTLPDVVKEAVASNLAVLKSPSCLRLEDGTFYAWEGVAPESGTCEGSCSHVLNYAQALAFLFPDLEESIRESFFKYNINEYGASKFRILLPLGIHASQEPSRPCADGQFGDVMKIYRDWKISGNDEFIRKHWHMIKRTIEFAWSPENQDLWDPDESGVLTGRQHHTLDMELFGPNSWLTGHYLGALDAAAKLADFMNDTAFAEKCRTIAQKGKQFVDKHLFNGEYFTQKIDIENQEMLQKVHAEEYWSKEFGEIRYQIAGGCGIDAVLAQTYADIYGLDEIFDRKKYRQTLQSIYKYNFKKSMRDFANMWRIFSLNDEAGTIICSWPLGNKPATPLSYNTETMTGFEWMFATALASQGDTEKAIEIAKAIRDRFDGRKRNPYNEFECGSNYVRSMASYGLLAAFSGFKYDRREGMLGFSPILTGEFQTFWALGDIWGTYFQDGNQAIITLMHGSFTLKKLLLDREFDTTILPVELHPGDSLKITFK